MTETTLLLASLDGPGIKARSQARSRLYDGATFGQYEPNSRRLPARSVCWIDNPVRYPPGRAKLLTRPVPTDLPPPQKQSGWPR